MSAPHTEVIVLAGGLGTRLQAQTGNTPKCLAPINGKPFLEYLIDHLTSRGFQHFVFALGHGAAPIQDFLSQKLQALQQKNAQLIFSYSVENEPLGTGGAILQALQYCTTENVLSVNGDSIFLADTDTALTLHLKTKAICTLLLKEMQQADRYGTVLLNNQQIITHFQEKQPGSHGWINAGMYWINKQALQQLQMPLRFSWENDFLQTHTATNRIAGAIAEGYFIDIGIPADYVLAQTNFKTVFNMLKPSKNWTLFLDRDGVINIEKVKDYIHTWEEFVFYEDALDALTAFSKMFERIIIVTNQKGIGKGVTKPEDLATIHYNLQQAVKQSGGRIDAIYFCPDLNDDSPNRKPNAGMAFQAKADFAGIDFARSVIVGNNASDMLFGRNAGMHTVFLRTTQPKLVLPPGLADMEIDSLSNLVKAWS